MVITTKNYRNTHNLTKNRPITKYQLLSDISVLPYFHESTQKFTTETPHYIPSRSDANRQKEQKKISTKHPEQSLKKWSFRFVRKEANGDIPVI